MECSQNMISLCGLGSKLKRHLKKIFTETTISESKQHGQYSNKREKRKIACTWLIKVCCCQIVKISWSGDLK